MHDLGNFKGNDDITPGAEQYIHKGVSMQYKVWRDRHPEDIWGGKDVVFSVRRDNTECKWRPRDAGVVKQAIYILEETTANSVTIVHPNHEFMVWHPDTQNADERHVTPLLEDCIKKHQNKIKFLWNHRVEKINGDKERVRSVTIKNLKNNEFFDMECSAVWESKNRYYYKGWYHDNLSDLLDLLKKTLGESSENSRSAFPPKKFKSINEALDCFQFDQKIYDFNKTAATFELDDTATQLTCNHVFDSKQDLEVFLENVTRVYENVPPFTLFHKHGYPLLSKDKIKLID